MKIAKVLEQLYFASSRYFTFYEPDDIKDISASFLLTQNVYLAGDWIDNSRKQAINDVKNNDAIAASMLCNIDDVLKILKRHEKVDYDLSIVI